ncbi:NAD(P)-dependent oxidoreductase [Plantactinospora sp. KLBMP9567]|uniref:NAD-dependent epimerase/dehydratase family protein n=1 Tax=Plantactinospora sp. KLBMP9567 TaxID=3085900 RepID=UPI0029823FA5|nr:NAD(P)-dependent oxidoreductase [Plantactinospora sp. KLBMP9567]MDW5323250.1 NAD(P)-dependent oxidoreductase [Plantactinospora sp. KLBMP9567]MDW5330715.1 NAD(P)-dependent oxidoreductase [Plantactinospora sp. KLBMP9567]
MEKLALVVGATGQVGRAAVRALVADGWHVRAAARGLRAGAPWPPHWNVELVPLDREDDAGLAVAVGDGCDVLVDTVAYDARHARQLLRLADRIGSAVIVSTAGVYLDDAGRGFGAEGVRFPVPIAETQQTVVPLDPDAAPDAETYAAGKAALERELLAAGAVLPTTLLRAGAIHGPHTVHPREWHFVKRALDHRPVRVLAYAGQSRFHPVSTANLAELIRLSAAEPGARVLNAGDPEPPTVREIGAAVHAVLDHGAEDVLIDGPSPAPPVGETPWSTPCPVVLDMSLAERQLGYRPVTNYLDSLPETVRWLVDAAHGRDWRTVFPDLAQNYRTDYFDYLAEDAWLRRRTTG